MTSRRSVLLASAAALALPGRAFAQREVVWRNDLGPLALPVKQDDTVAPGYRRDLLLRWGDRVAFDAPRWDPERPDAEAAAAQFGWDARVVGIAVPPPAADGVQRGVLVVAHPTVNAALAWPQAGGAVRDLPAVAGAMQGASFLNLEKHGPSWVVVDGGYQTRRLTAATFCRLAGPASPGGSGVRGVLGVAGGCVTPWGSVLLAEDDPAGWAGRLAPLDPAFAQQGHYGWMVEVNPHDPQAMPVKRSALGHFAHADAAATLSRDGRAVIYMTEHRPGGLLFRFVSSGLATEPDALDQGILAVAQFAGDRLTWLPLPEGAALDPVAVARQAGGSPLDMPSGLGLDPQRRRLLLACRGSGRRPAGYVLEITAREDDAGPDATVLTLFVAGSPAAGGRYGRSGLPAGSAWPENPDSVAVDGRGRAWIGTNRGGQVGQQADGLFVCDLEGGSRGVPLPLYGAPRAAAMGGAALTPDGEALFSAVRRPGGEPGVTFARPSTRWPAFEAGVPPRSALVAFLRGAGGPVGG